MSEKLALQCACGETITSAENFNFEKAEETNEIAIICPNPVCIFQEIGRCKYASKEFTSSNLVEAEFISAFSTWNAINNGIKNNTEILKKMLIEIVTTLIPQSQTNNTKEPKK